MVKKIGEIMITIKGKNSATNKDALNQLETMIETNNIIEILVTSEFKIHIDKIDLFSDELRLLVDKYKT